jgi:CheY-like chemotaxis protein
MVQPPDPMQEKLHPSPAQVYAQAFEPMHLQVSPGLQVLPAQAYPVRQTSTRKTNPIANNERFMATPSSDWLLQARRIPGMDAKRNPVRTSLNRLLDFCIIGLIMPENGPVHEATLERPPKIFFQILIVDDEQVSRNLLRAVLNGEGYTEIDEVGSGKEAVQALKAKEYHLVLLDKNLPEGDGTHVLKIAKELRPGIEVILITDFETMEAVIEALDLGAYGCLTKPLPDIPIIRDRIEGALERVTVRHQNSILLGRLGTLLEHLEGSQGRSSPQAMAQRLRQAAERLRRIIDELKRLG